MAFTISISHFTPITFLYFLLLSTCHLPILAINITHILSSYPDLSDFTNLLATTSVAADLTQRSSLTLLAVPNTFLRSSDLLNHRPPSSSTNLGDILRYHVLLEYLSWPDLRLIPPTGKLVTTLFQTTGRAPNNFGSVNITRNSNSNSVTVHSPTSNATIITLLKTLPYNISVFTVDSLLVPNGFDLMASETRPPLGLNITKTLIDGHNFNVAASMLTASGVEEEFERDEGGAGLTLFVPTDEAFSEMSASNNFQSLPAEKKAVVLRFHVLHSYYPLGSLESIVNPVQPTLATEQNGAGSFTLNISRVNDSVGINTGIVQASVTQTVFDQNPVAIFGVSKVLLPREFFGKNPIEVNKPITGVASPPEIALPPENLPGIYGPPSHLSSPPGLGTEVSSAANRKRGGIFLWCIGFFYLLLVIN
ncbi:PREDICTED: fasciclin-like arabinogalactan protein 4 [Nicotiana attenuata]|uniref:Fasciclin-like arabinogalactan protein 4 n=1 Tax=Nicotiana attenuata TaxID=49451 RepID=A0A1J6ID48_NICAT|nr:PREDICTED: fasciclin-like arabinogalactan protein 4 [Nicotiana attenuata]OIT02522.1 fasciclin-like arabinogalactan protein 4 [Nicotiana attenuata]